MQAPPDNDATVLAVFRDRFQLPMEHLQRGRIVIATVPRATCPVRAFERGGGAVVVVDYRHREVAHDVLAWRDPADLHPGLGSLAHQLAARVFTGVARTGVTIARPRLPVEVVPATDPRLPRWARGHFTGEAWVITDSDGRVLSAAALKRYDNRLREIAVGTAERARNRGLARTVVAAAASAVLAEGRAVLYNHASDNFASARVAEAVGLRPLGVFHTVVPERRAGREAAEDWLALA